MAHAKISPSGAPRWTECPGSISASEGMPDKTSIHAWRGTVLHDLSEKQLTDLSATMPAPGTQFICPEDRTVVYTLTADDLDYVDDYVDFVRSRASE